MLANDPYFYAGGWTASASEKVTRFVDLAETFHLPVVHFVDNPGFVIGTDAEKAATIRYGARALAAIYQATTPWCSVIIRKVYGVAGAAHQDASKLSYRFAWPSGNWGSLPLEGGIEAAYKAQLEAADDPDALRAEIEQRLAARQSPFKTAEAFLVEEIIDPRDTRPLLCEFAELAARVLEKGTNGPRSAPLIGTMPVVDSARMATTFWPNADHWSCEIPLDTPHPRLDALAARGFVQLTDLPFEIPARRVPRPRVHGLEERRRHQLRADRHRRRRARLPRLLERGRRASRQGRALHDQRGASARRSSDYVESVGADFGRVRTIKLEPQDHDTAFRSFHRDDNNRFNPPTDGWVVRTWLELTDNPTSYMLLMDTGPRRSPRSGDRSARPVAQGRALRRRHAAAVARRRAQRRRAALRADHQLRERSRARSVDRLATPVAAALRRHDSVSWQSGDVPVVGNAIRPLTAPSIRTTRYHVCAHSSTRTLPPTPHDQVAALVLRSCLVIEQDLGPVGFVR